MINKELLLQIAGHFGTPVYVYDLEKIREQYRKLSGAFSQLDTDIHFAVKSNHNPAIIKTIHEEGGQFDTVSLEEVLHLMELGIPKDDILFTPSCPSKEELKKAFTAGIKIHIGSMEYLEWIAKEFPGRAFGLRINPGLDIGGNKKIATAHAHSKFGIPWAYHDELLNIIRSRQLKITGLHVHLGSDIGFTQMMKESIVFLADIQQYFPDLEYLDIGGGFKIKYKEEDRETDMNELAQFIKKVLEESGRKLKIKIEPGKFLVAEAGKLLTRVNLIKKTPGKNFVCVNTGFNHFIRPMYYGAYHEIENISNPGAKPQIYDVVGNLCEEDTFAYDRPIPQVHEGDILSINNTGAYGYVMASHYNLRKLPKEIIVDGNKIYEV